VTTSGAEMIGEERLRQVRHPNDGGEGFSHAHDDGHAEGVLTAAADCYIYLTHSLEAPEEVQGLYWPWHPSWFRPSPDPRRNLVKAGALYLAEAERYDREHKLDLADRCRHVAAQLARSIDLLG
jgi:hypothetical protein